MKMRILLLSLLLIFGCEDKEKDQIREADALLRWTGEFAVDGCGFFIDIKDHEYKPEDEKTIHDSLKISGGADVFIRYELLNEKIEYYCGESPQPSKTDGIKLYSIGKR